MKEYSLNSNLHFKIQLSNSKKSSEEGRMKKEQALVVLLLGLAVAFSMATNLRPIIGVLSQPDTDQNPPTRNAISASYVKWIESAGARVALIPYDAPEEELTRVFNSINGLLYPGGGQNLTAELPFFKASLFLYKLALEANKKGDYFPLWGTCQGFQLLTIIVAQDFSVLQTYVYDSENLPLAIDLTKGALDSRLLGSLSPKVLSILTGQNSTINLHHDGVDPSVFNTNPYLAQQLQLLSTNVDRKKKPFASTWEAKDWPMYAVQWHPERNAFEWDLPEQVPHTPDAVFAMQAVANFFVTEARKSEHKFPTLADELKYSSFSFDPVYTGQDPNDHYPDQQTYYFPKRT